MRDYPKKFSTGLSKRKNLPLFEEGGEVESGGGEDEELDPMSQMMEPTESEDDRKWPLPPSYPDPEPEEDLGTVDEKLEPIEEPLKEHSEEPIKPKRHKPDYFRGLSIKS